MFNVIGGRGCGKTDYLLRVACELYKRHGCQTTWLRALYETHGVDPDDVDTRKLIPVKVPGGWVLEGRQHHLNDNLYWRFRK